MHPTMPPSSDVIDAIGGLLPPLLHTLERITWVQRHLYPPLAPRLAEELAPSTDAVAEPLRAVEALADQPSPCAIPVLIRLLQEEKREGVRFWASEGMPDMQMTPVTYSLYRIGNVALTKIFEAERAEEERMFKAEGNVHWSCDEFLGILTEIRRALEKPGQLVMKMSYTRG